MGLSYCRRMQRTVDMILGFTAAVATALHSVCRTHVAARNVTAEALCAHLSDFSSQDEYASESASARAISMPVNPIHRCLIQITI